MGPRSGTSEFSSALHSWMCATSGRKLRILNCGLPGERNQSEWIGFDFAIDQRERPVEHPVEAQRKCPKCAAVRFFSFHFKRAACQTFRSLDMNSLSLGQYLQLSPVQPARHDDLYWKKLMERGVLGSETRLLRRYP